MKQAEEGRKRDLDETRRLAYMALMSKGTQNYELAATIANALVHHQQAAEVGDALTYLMLTAHLSGHQIMINGHAISPRLSVVAAIPADPEPAVR